MFRIKICGITSIDDAPTVADAGADAIGLNFFAESPRYVEPQQAAEIVAALASGGTSDAAERGERGTSDAADRHSVLKVGLFVNAPGREVCRLFDELDLDVIQLHGDEPPAYLADLGARRVIRAFRLGRDGLAPILEFFDECVRLGASPSWILIDAHRPGLYGGTGAVADWEALAQMPRRPTLPPIVLAGGLSPDNVAEAIALVRPAAVDTASGVESSPGRKDPQKVAAFVQAARTAFDSL